MKIHKKAWYRVNLKDIKRFLLTHLITLSPASMVRLTTSLVTTFWQLLHFQDSAAAAGMAGSSEWGKTSPVSLLPLSGMLTDKIFPLLAFSQPLYTRTSQELLAYFFFKPFKPYNLCKGRLWTQSREAPASREGVRSAT